MVMLYNDYKVKMDLLLSLIKKEDRPHKQYCYYINNSTTFSTLGELQRSIEDEYRYDRDWFNSCNSGNGRALKMWLINCNAAYKVVNHPLTFVDYTIEIDG